ncbi:hypothetical protein NPX13_g9230 [Xylaria arbuscula]|uniref:ubiquitinyl hydrolase 1 n=1 Tax=Xylaria arbuscula TaxID=114810 RepID=A0A9W8THW4_9PEZI|nr:hypothetical protein NPX13_g9230 [Xylaria arbuscula]
MARMQSIRPQPPLDHTRLHTPSSYLADGGSLSDRLLQPSILVPFGILLLTVLYQSLHSSTRFSHFRHPGELLWDSIIAVAPARLLYAIDHWLHPPLFPVPESTSITTQSSSYAAKSEVLRRILGMDSPNSILSAVAHAGKSISSLSSVKPKQVSDHPPGLGNYDNSCFQNSILQSLSSLKPFPAYLASALEDAEGLGDSRDTSSAATLRALLSKLVDTQNNGSTLWTPKKLKSLDTWQQQDAQEYYSKILDEVDKEVTKVAAAQSRPLGLEVIGLKDDSAESQHSDDSGYQSLSTLGKPASEIRTARNPLEGLVAQRVACVSCHYSEGLSMIPFNCITLNLGIDQGAHDLYERLDAYTALESIEGVECAKCTLLKLQRLLNIIVGRSKEVGSEGETLREPLARLKAVEEALEEENFDEQTLGDKCKISKQHRVSSTKTKQMVIGRPPASLAIHINRSVFDENTGQMFKNLAAVRFPSTLDLGPWCLGSAGLPTSDIGDITQSAEEQWTSDPKRSMVSGDLSPSKISGPIYELRAVITHQGRHENGHYVCYRQHPCQVAKTENDSNLQADKSPIKDVTGSAQQGDSESQTDLAGQDLKWWRLSDETVWEVTEESVLAQGGVFMLFYDCVDHNPVLVSDTSESASIDRDDAKSVEGSDSCDAKPNASDRSCNTRPSFKAHDANEEAIHHSPEQELATQSGCDASSRLSSLLLKQDEEVDPMIPLRWPNS